MLEWLAGTNYLCAHNVRLPVLLEGHCLLAIMYVVGGHQLPNIEMWHAMNIGNHSKSRREYVLANTY